MSKRIVTVVLISAMVISLLAGCRQGTDDEDDLSDFVFVPQFITLPGEMHYIRGLAYSNELLYIASNEILDEDLFINTAKIYSMNLDGSNLTELADYSPNMPDAANAAGSIEVDVFGMDTEGFFWVCETANFVDDDSGDYVNVSSLRKLSSTGAELLYIDLSSLFNSINPHAWFYIIEFVVDRAGNIFLNLAMSGIRVIYVLSDDGMMQFELDYPPWESNLFIMPDGNAALFTYGEGISRRLQLVDYGAKAWGLQ